MSKCLVDEWKGTVYAIDFTNSVGAPVGSPIPHPNIRAVDEKIVKTLMTVTEFHQLLCKLKLHLRENELVDRLKEEIKRLQQADALPSDFVGTVRTNLAMGDEEYIKRLEPTIKSIVKDLYHQIFKK